MNASHLARLYALTLLIVLSTTRHASAQRPPTQQDSARILHEIHGLEVLGSVLYIAAHPDDENTRLISWLANGRQMRTAYLSLTRGDGGQNLIGSELGPALGIVRTQELLEARRIDGGEQFFTRATDFGYSKNPEETFEKWGRAAVLGDVVRVIRTFRPDVIVTRFDTDGSGGHGHHTASSILAREAFALAADPAAYPDQLHGELQPWQTKRLFFNGSTWWRAELAEIAKKEPERWMALDVGGFEPLLGLSFTEIAGRSRSLHKSQGFGAAETRGSTLDYVRLDLGTKYTKPDLLDGIETTWARLGEGGAAVQRAIRQIGASFDVNAPEASVMQLVELARTIDALAGSDHPERAWATVKAEAVSRLILQACGVVVEVTAKTARASRGEPVAVNISALQRRPTPLLALEEFGLLGADPKREREPLSVNRQSLRSFTFETSEATSIDEPHWLTAADLGQSYSGAAEAALILPMTRSVATLRTAFAVDDGDRVSVIQGLAHTWVDRVAGERARPFVITPIASVIVSDPVALVRTDRTSVKIAVEALRADLSGTFEVTLPDGWSLDSRPAPIEHLKSGERREVLLNFVRASGAQQGRARVAFVSPWGRADRTLRVIDYPHIQPQTWYTPAEIVLVPIDLDVRVQRIGFIEGAGDEMPAALARLGLEVLRIDPASATAQDLDACDAIVTGIRAYNTVRALTRFQATLLAYVERGGTLVVQYNTNGNDLVMKSAEIGPFPFSITRDRVTVEETPPQFSANKHPLLHQPNEITAADFDGWVQERGVYFTGDLDPAYVPLITWSDPGEKPSSGALIVCDHGKGRFIYTGLSLFRQLPAGVPGAYRLLANLIQRRTQRE